MQYPNFIKKAGSQALYYYYKLSGIAQRKVLVKSVRTEVKFNSMLLPQREFVALNKRGKEMAWSKVLLGRFQEKPYHYCIVNGIAVRALYRRRALGYKLVTANIKFCKKEGFELLIAYVESTNIASLSMFKKCGFKFIPKAEWAGWMKAERDLMNGDDLLLGMICLREE